MLDTAAPPAARARCLRSESVPHLGGGNLMENAALVLARHRRDSTPTSRTPRPGQRGLFLWAHPVIAPVLMTTKHARRRQSRKALSIPC
jgi:hypothetical protein